MNDAPSAEHPFADLDDYVALPRVGGLALSPDGSRLVVGVQTLNNKKNSYVTALWEVDPNGQRPARRLTRSAEGEGGAAFTPNGDLLFISARPEPDGEDGENPKPALWLLPVDGGEARMIASPPGGVAGFDIARAAGSLVLQTTMLPSATDFEDDEQRRKDRKDGKVTAMLHETYPVRYWDADIGPQRERLLVAEPTDKEEPWQVRDLTGHVGGALHNASFELTPDGSTVITDWTVPEAGGGQRASIVAIDITSGERRTLAQSSGTSGSDYEYEGPRVPPDGSQVVIAVYRRSTPHEPPATWLAVVPVAGGDVRDLTREWDRMPRDVSWLPDGSGLVVAADDHGRGPLFHVDIGTGQVRQLTADHGVYGNIDISTDGQWVYALRSAMDAAPAPVRVPLAPSKNPAQPEYLRGPAEALHLPGRLEEVTTTAEDGTAIRSWLVIPHEVSAQNQAPLQVWIHGGPLGSWNAWSWRWNPWLAVARGYAVLLPDPALSTGYGQDFIRRGWGAWGDEPYTDLMLLTDAAVARDVVDADRTAALGGSFGGYMANWVAGHTDRFKAIVTHASLWALDQFSGTTDAAFYWTLEMTEEMAQANSPHQFVDDIVTPMLVIHGDKDYRVPIGEGLRLWWDLMSRQEAADGSGPHKFLYFPDENHWILTPNHAKVWYETVFAFVDQHVLGKDWQRPELLG